jgi:hypothetical protein
MLADGNFSRSNFCQWSERQRETSEQCPSLRPGGVLIYCVTVRPWGAVRRWGQAQCQIRVYWPRGGIAFYPYVNKYFTEKRKNLGNKLCPKTKDGLPLPLA